MSLKRSAALLAVWLLVGSCGRARVEDDLSLARLSQIKGPTGEMISVAWPTQETIAVSYNPDPADNLSQPRLWTLHPDGSVFQALSVEDTGRDCYWVAHLALLAMPDGSIAYVRECSSRAQAPPFVLSIEQHDLSTGSTKTLVAGPMHVATGSFTFDPTGASGIYGESGNPCVTLVRFTSAGVFPWDVTVKDGDREWSLATARAAGSACQDVGRASSPAWSPDGKRIAFFVSADSIGVDGPSRLDAPWRIVLMGAGQQVAEPSGPEFVDPGALKWSPDGRWLAFAAGATGDGGVYLLDPTTTKPRLVAKGLFSDVAWSPDGHRLVAIEFNSLTPPFHDHLVLADVSRIVM